MSKTLQQIHTDMTNTASELAVLLATPNYTGLHEYQHNPGYPGNVNLGANVNAPGYQPANGVSGNLQYGTYAGVPGHPSTVPAQVTQSQSAVSSGRALSACAAARQNTSLAAPAVVGVPAIAPATKPVVYPGNPGTGRNPGNPVYAPGAPATYPGNPGTQRNPVYPPTPAGPKASPSAHTLLRN
jgi:hypothetical protein